MALPLSSVLEGQEKEYRHIDEEKPLNTRLMYFDLMQLAKDNK